MNNNQIYKKLLIVLHKSGGPKPKEIFTLSGAAVTNSQLQGWRVSDDHRHWRPMSDDALEDFLNGLVEWAASND